MNHADHYVVCRSAAVRNEFWRDLVCTKPIDTRVISIAGKGAPRGHMESESPTKAGRGQSPREWKVAIRNSVVRRATRLQSQVPRIQLRLNPVAPDCSGGERTLFSPAEATRANHGASEFPPGFGVRRPSAALLRVFQIRGRSLPHHPLFIPRAPANFLNHSDYASLP
jgi:hypothetical protein